MRKPVIILASKSPRRRELLHSIGLTFEVDPASGLQEVAANGRKPEDLVLENARGKACEVAERHPGKLVLGVDTIGVFGDQILEKPHDEEDAHRMLSMLQGNTHEVLTAMCLKKDKKEITRLESTLVTFTSLSDKEIRDYIKTGEPMDKAAAYAVQEIGALFVKRIEGDYFNVVGLPLCALNLMLKEFDIELLRDVK